MINNKKMSKGITLIALVVTIIVLLILAGISIMMLTGDNGIIKNAAVSKTTTEIEYEKEAIAMEYIGLHPLNHNETLDLEVFKNQIKNKLDINSEVMCIGENEYIIKLISKNRAYIIDKNGQIQYLGTIDDVHKMALIELDRECDNNYKYIHTIKAKITTYDESDLENLKYGWTESNTEPPPNYQTINLNKITNNLYEVEITNPDTLTGEYYLWLELEYNENIIKKTAGSYRIREQNNTIVSCSSESNKTSGFLGNTEIQRGKIRKITILDNIEGHNKNDDRHWDISAKKNESALGWYEEITIGEENYYDVTIGQLGGVVARADSRNLFRNIGADLPEDIYSELINVENLYTSDITGMVEMFRNSKFKTLNLNSFDTSNVNDLFSMFYGCNNLTSLDVSSFDTSNVINMACMFCDCSNLTSLDVSNFNTENVTNMGGLFNRCRNLTNLDLSKWNVSNVTTFYQNYAAHRGMFMGCSKLEALDLSSWNTSSAKNMSWMFYDCSSLISLNISKFDTKKVTTMYAMFYGCSSLDALDVSKFDLRSVTNMAVMFYGCSNLTSLDVSGFNTENVTNMGGVFCGCKNLSSLDLTEWNVSNVKNFYENLNGDRGMFKNCLKLETLDLSSWHTSNATDMREMFCQCSNLTTIYASDNFDTSLVTNSTNMFRSSTKLIGGNGTTYSSSHIDKEYARLDNNENPGYFSLKTN